MKAMKRYVESVVRPIRASDRRKDRMREELLAHLSQLYAEELTHAVDEVAAFAQATTRFGDAAALSRELRTSVPFIERWAWLRLPGFNWLDRRSNESATAQRLRLMKLAAWVEGPCLALIIVIGVCFLKPAMLGTAIAAAAPILTALFLQVSLVSWTFLCEAIRRDLHGLPVQPATGSRRVKLRVIACAVLSMVLFGGVTSAGLVMNGAFDSAFAGSAWLLGALLGALVTALTVWESAAAERRFEEWGSLDVDAGPTP